MRMLLVTVAVPLIALYPQVARAQARAGVRAGVSAEPNQFYVGGHIESRPLVERLSFRPNVEVGVGDEVTVVAINIEFVYGFPLRRQPWRVYIGGGPAANVFMYSQARGDESDVGGGFNLLAGFEHKDGLFTEIKIGALDSPSFKFAVGYNFKR